MAPQKWRAECAACPNRLQVSSVLSIRCGDPRVDAADPPFSIPARLRPPAALPGCAGPVRSRWRGRPRTRRPSSPPEPVRRVEASATWVRRKHVSGWPDDRAARYTSRPGGRAMSKWNSVRYRTNRGTTGEIRLAPDGLWTHPDDPSLDPEPLVDAYGRQLGAPRPGPLHGRQLARAGRSLSDPGRRRRDQKLVTQLCENMGLEGRHRTRVVRLLALMYWLKGLLTDHIWETICHHVRRGGS